MYSQRLSFTPQEDHLRYQEERNQYVERLKAYQAGSTQHQPLSTQPRAPAPAPQPEPAKTKGPLGQDLLLLGALLLLLMEDPSTQDTVLIGILIYLLLG